MSATRDDVLSTLEHLRLRAVAAERERDQLRDAQSKWLASPEAAKRLDGYRELGAKCAALEAQRDDLLGALNAARVELRNGQTELEYGHDQKRSRTAGEQLALMLDSEGRVIRGHEQAIEAIDAALAKARGAK